MQKTIVQKAVDLTVSAWPIEHPSDLEKVVQIFELVVKEGHRAKDDEIYQYVLGEKSGEDRETTKHLASELQEIYQVVKAMIDPDASRWNEQWVRKELFE